VPRPCLRTPAFTLAVYVHLLADDLPDPDFLDMLTGPKRRIEATLAIAEQVVVLDLTRA
jgi:hypothetical protein